MKITSNKNKNNLISITHTKITIMHYQCRMLLPYFLIPTSFKDNLFKLLICDVINCVIKCCKNDYRKDYIFSNARVALLCLRLNNHVKTDHITIYCMVFLYKLQCIYNLSLIVQTSYMCLNVNY